MQKTQEKHIDPDDNVKLKPIMGIRPGVYLTVLYSAVLLLLIFIFLILPGLRNPGALLLVKTNPEGAAVRIDDHYMGNSGSYIKVAKGMHNVTVVLPGFEPESFNIDIPGRVIGSLIFPIRKKTEAALKPVNIDSVLTQAANEFAKWSFAGEPTSAWQIPLVLSEGAYRMGQYASPESQEILKAASRFTVTKAALRDISRAKVLLDNKGLSPSPVSLVNSISDVLIFLSQNFGSAAWLSGLLPQESSSLIRESSWHWNEVFSVNAASQDTEFEQGVFEFLGIPFIIFPSGSFEIYTAAGSKLSTSTKIENFMMSENPVPRSLFETFLNENPQWTDGYTDYEEEISLYPSEIYDGYIISGVSWYAAKAFCSWMTEMLPPSMSEMEVRLPAEVEWEFAYMKKSEQLQRIGWEWCEDLFAPLEFNASEAAIEAVGSPERTLAGKPSSLEVQSRSSFPPELSSPFITFRLVIAGKKSE